MKKICIIAGVMILLVWSAFVVVTVKADDNGLIMVESTAYYDKYNHGHGATGEKLIEGLTLAGKKEWLGMSAALYDMNMNYLGTYQFSDVGYGQSSGYGSSKLLKGRSIGTIENGTCIDIYFDTYADCMAWGRKNVYMKLIEAKG